MDLLQPSYDSNVARFPSRNALCITSLTADRKTRLPLTLNCGKLNENAMRAPATRANAQIRDYGKPIIPGEAKGLTLPKAGQDSRTPRRYRDRHAPSNVRQVLECGAPAALFFGRALDDRDAPGLD